MSETFNQSINQPIARPARIQNRVAQAGFTGTTDTAILRMNAAAAVNTGGAFTEVTTAADGTIVTVGLPGLYLAKFTWVVSGAASIAVGIGVDLATGAAITADPAYATAGVIYASDPITGVAALAISGDAFATFTVSGAQAAAGRTVMFMITDSAAGAPVGTVAAGLQYEITKIAEIAD